jgi:hypothetical protein
MTTEQLIARLRERHAGKQLPPPASPELMAKAEDLIGFQLPPLLKALYGELANGGFGPVFVPLFSPTPHRPFGTEQDGAIDMYMALREADLEYELDLMECEGAPRNSQFSWRPKLIPLCEWGCNIRSAVDCAKPDLPVFRADPNKSVFLSRESPSLAKWLEDWLDSKGSFAPVR